MINCIIPNRKVTEIDRIKANVDFLAMLNGVELEVSGDE